MIIIKQNTSRLDSQIDRLQQQVVEKLHRTLGSQEHGQHQSLSWQITDIQTAALSLPKTSKDVLPPSRLADLISNVSRTLPKPHNEPHDISAAYQSDLVWLVTAKAAVRTLGLVLINLVEETHILSDEILYWDDILVSPWYIGFHVAQTTPFYIWDGAKNIFKEMNHDIQGQQSSSMTTRWTQFYDLIRQRVYMQPVSSVRTRISSHFALCKSEIRQKQKVLKAMKDLYASSVGLLMKDCLSFDFDENLPSTNGHQPVGSQWRDALTKNIILMEAILHNIADHSHVADFERSVSTTLRAEEHSVRSQFDERMMFENPSLLHERLVQILKELVPKHVAFSRAASQKYGHPPWIVRYWLPISFLLLSTSTSLRVLANKRAEILQWVMDIGSTAVDFWGNWVVEPIQRLVGTIRHDKDSEIAIMSKNSLEADRASLERMVVDFVQDRPLATHNEAVPIDAQTITASVKEGDLTPVLKAYERDLRSPFVGTVRGDLIRALLIQIQKTKVDVEVAISGIDSLLKSQELVFGFVGLTPGILVSYSVFQYVFSLFGSRRGLRKSKEQYQLRHALRNVDRTLATSSASANGILTYKGHGLLICESELLLEKAKYALHGADFRKFSEDIGDLIDVQLGVDRQLEVVRRIAAYGVLVTMVMVVVTTGLNILEIHTHFLASHTTYSLYAVKY